MATRLNKRFIFIISAIIFVLAIGVGGVAYVVISGDAERQVRLGKIAEEKGDLKDALSRYGRAIGKDPRNLEYYDLFENVLFKVVPETRVEAVERYNRQYIGLLERRRGASVDSPDSWLRLLDVYRDRAMVFNSRNQSDMWGDVQEHTQRMVDQFDYDSDGVGREANLAARGMRLHAMSMRPELLKPDEEQIFKSDSVELMNAGSKDPLVWESVLRMSLSRAESHASRGDDRLLMRELADEENGFDTVRARMQEVEIQDTPEITTLLYERAVLNPEDVAEAQREAIHNLVYAETERVAGEILESDSGDQKEALRKKLHQLTLTNILTTDDAVTLLTPLLERNQLPLEMNMMICQNFVMSNPAFARLSAEKTLQLEPLSVSLQAMFQKEARGEAVLALFDAAYLDRAREQSDKEDPESMEGVTVTIEDLYAFKELALREFEGESDYEAVKLYLSGSIALATDDAATARSQFMEMSKTEFAKRPDMRFRYIPRLIASAVLSGERGAALAQLQSFVGQLAPGQGVNLRLRIASEMIRLGRLQDAKVELQKIIASDPKNEDAHSILNDLNVVIEQVQSAPGGTATEGDRRFGRIRSAVTEGRLEDARELLLSAIRVSDDPAFKRYLVLVNIQLGRDEEAREIASTVENWENDEALQRILSRIEVPDPIERIRMLSEISYEDPASRIAVEFTALQRLANSDLPGNEEARKLLPGVFERVLANMTSDAKLHQTLVAATIIEDERSGRENTPEAMSLRVIEVITENETDEVQLANLRAVVVSAQKGPVAGMSILQPVIDRGIANAESWFIMGLGYRQLGRLKEATECLSRAVERSPDNPQYVTWLALSLEQGGEPLKALVVLRQSQLSESTRTALQEAWLMVEADFGEKRVALAHRHEVFNVDMDEANSSDQVIIRVGNALHYARLLLIVKPEREDLLDRNEQPVYSPVAWTRMSGATRRSMIALERENRRERAFEVLELVMEASRSPESRLSAMIAKAEAFQIIGDSESAMGVVAEVLECCGDSLSVPQRLSLIDLLVEIGAEKEVNLQFEALAREEDPSDLRRSIAVALGTGRSDHAVHIATKLFDKTGLPSDRTQLIRAQLSKNMLEEAGIAIAELDADEEVRNSDVLRYETLILDSNLEGLRGLAILRESEIDTRELARVTREKDTAAMDTLLMQIESKKSSAIEYLDNSIRLSDEAIELNKRSPLPLIHKHNMLRTKVLLVDDASAEEDLLSNARLAREIAPMEWRTNRAVVQGYAVIGETKEALAALDQYFRRGGLHDEARETITRIALTEGKPGLAIPSLKVAMSHDPSNPEWPRAIALLLMEAKDIDSASEMWWKVLELDTSPAAIDSFVELEFRRGEPNTSRLLEVFEMIPEQDRARPELRGAMAVTLMLKGDKRRSVLMMRDAYKEAKEEVAAGEDPIVVDRVLTYFFKMNDEETIEDSEVRLRELAGGQLGAHEYGALASHAMQGDVGSRNLGAAKRYLRSAADQVDGEELYKKVLLHQLATVLYLTEDCDGAVRALEEVVSLGNAQASTMNNLAYMLVDCQNDPNSAIVYSTQALRASATSPAYLDTHGYILFKLGRLAEAERVLARSVSISPSVSSLLHLAQLMHATGRDGRAEILIEKIGKDFSNVSPTQQQEINDLISKMG